MIAWVDVETSGLDPYAGELLEIGVILTDDDLNEKGRTSFVIAPRSRLYLNGMSEQVRRMHTKSKLLLELDRSDLPSLEEVELFLFHWLSARSEEPLVVAGSTVGFDRAWIKAKMPLVERAFHYRSIDVSSLKELNRRWEFAPEWTGSREKHRALPDLEDSIAELRHYRGGINASR
jgi:oligoribonuclease